MDENVGIDYENESEMYFYFGYAHGIGIGNQVYARTRQTISIHKCWS